MKQRRALISVSNQKQGLQKLAKSWWNWDLRFCPRGTASSLQATGLPVTPVSDVTGFPGKSSTGG